MCFSATASFAMGGLLVPAGAYAIAKARRGDARWLPFAVYPLAFGVQQITEGFVWHGLTANEEVMTVVAARAFMFFSHFFWLFWVPLSVWLTESDGTRKRMLAILCALGTLLGLGIFLPALIYPESLTVAIINHSIDYSVALNMKTEFNVGAIRLAYGAIIIGALILSSDRRIQLFGALVGAALIVTFLFYEYALISVWCFFAAGLSAYLAIAIAQDQRNALADNSS